MTRRALEGCLWLALLTSCLATLLLVKGGPPNSVLLMEPQGRLWWGWLTVVYLGVASHQALEYSELVEDHLQASSEELEKYGQVVSEAYRAADRAVGRLIESFGRTNVVILSDHGFKLLRPRSRFRTYGHFGPRTPDGIFIAAGPAFRSGRVEGLGIYDVMPMVLYLKGWPVAKDFVKGVPTEVFKEAFLAQYPVQTIDSDGAMRAELPTDSPLVADDEMVERLRALGYLD